MGTSHTTSLVLGDDCWITGGVATRHTRDRVDGHVRVVTETGAVSIVSESSGLLRSLADSLCRAADRLDAETAGEAVA